jgi:hypothetical protein
MCIDSGILPRFPCPGKLCESNRHDLDTLSIFRIPYDKSLILPAETAECGFLERLFKNVSSLLSLHMAATAFTTR